MRIAVFCEAPSDFETTAALLDRALAESVPWVAELIVDHPEAVRDWARDDGGRPFFDLHRREQYLRSRGLRARRGSFGAGPRHAGAVMARGALVLAYSEHERQPLDAVVLVWDADGDAKDRRDGLKQAREEAGGMPFAIVLGLADRMREAWVLAGFDPERELERHTLDAETKALGFAPNHEAHRLQDPDEGAPRSAKRVLRALTAEDREREARCLQGPLDVLRERGEGSGLRDFLDDIQARLVPLLGAAPS